MSDDEEQDKAARESAKNLVDAARKALEEERDNELVARWRHFESLAKRILSHDGEDVNYSDADARHLAEMLLLLDIARGSPVVRFRARFGGNY